MTILSQAEEARRERRAKERQERQVEADANGAAEAKPEPIEREDWADRASDEIRSIANRPAEEFAAIIRKHAPAQHPPLLGSFDGGKTWNEVQSAPDRREWRPVSRPEDLRCGDIVRLLEVPMVECLVITKIHHKDGRVGVQISDIPDVWIGPESGCMEVLR